MKFHKLTHKKCSRHAEKWKRVVHSSAYVELKSGRVYAPASMLLRAMLNTGIQGLTLAHLSAQPMPFLSVSRVVSSQLRVMTRQSTEGTQHIPSIY